jgi:hypothetical protein
VFSSKVTERFKSGSPNEARLSALSREDECDKRCEIAMIHPALHDIGPTLANQLGKPE